MKLEVGKFYKTRDGRKVGPVVFADAGLEEYPFAVPQEYVTYRKDGTHYSDRRESRADLISEWTSDGPVRTVTRKEIVPGVYGNVYVEDTMVVTCDSMRTPTELRAAAATLIEIADALEGWKDE